MKIFKTFIVWFTIVLLLMLTGYAYYKGFKLPVPKDNPAQRLAFGFVLGTNVIYMFSVILCLVESIENRKSMPPFKISIKYIQVLILDIVISMSLILLNILFENLIASLIITWILMLFRLCAVNLVNNSFSYGFLSSVVEYDEADIEYLKTKQEYSNIYNNLMK